MSAAMRYGTKARPDERGHFGTKGSFSIQTEELQAKIPSLCDEQMVFQLSILLFWSSKSSRPVM